MEIFYKKFKNERIDVIVGIESRGFIFVTPLDLKIGCKLVLAIKPGKLPWGTIRENDTLEYGTNVMKIHADAIKKDDWVLIIDDLLITEWTAKAIGKIIEKLNGNIVSFAFLIFYTN